MDAGDPETLDHMSTPVRPTCVVIRGQWVVVGPHGLLQEQLIQCFLGGGGKGCQEAGDSRGEGRGGLGNMRRTSAGLWVEPALTPALTAVRQDMWGRGKNHEVGLLRTQAMRPLQECATTKSSVDRECPR